MADTCWKILKLFELKSNYKKKIFFFKKKQSWHDLNLK